MATILAQQVSVTEKVRERYAAVAASSLAGDHAGTAKVAAAFGYSAEELAALPAEANMGLSCGNPMAIAGLRPGEVVVDLGCGGGMDVVLAAPKVGPTGRVIGIDMTPEMLDRARRSVGKAGLTNVEFHQASIDRLPLADNSADVIISNCVINLAPDKAAVFAEMFRVLKPGGRVAVSDLALKKPLPSGLASRLDAYVACIAGAISVTAYREGLAAAGFDAIEIIDTGADLNAYSAVEGQSGCCSPAMESSPAPLGGLALPQASDCCGSGESSAPAVPNTLHGELSSLLREFDINEFVASVKVLAVKSGRAS